MNNKLLDYFNGDDLAASVWKDKYQLKDLLGNPVEETPQDLHLRMVKEFSRIEKFYQENENLSGYENLSEFGKKYRDELSSKTLEDIEDSIFTYFDKYRYIVPQGSVMTILGNPFKTGSLSNCFVVPPPSDSYGGILHSDEHLVQLMKRRGGVGTHLNNLRPTGGIVTNSAGTSTGVPSFAERYSNTTREVAQKGRRGALMLLLSCLHPDIFNFTKMKQDRTKVTGANVSVMLTDKFMEAVKNDELFLCRFPIDITDEKCNDILMDLNYDWKSDFNLNKMYQFNVATVPGGRLYIMVINAKELFNLIIEMAWENAEPGVAFMDRVWDYSPDGVYEQFKAISSNPCGEQWLQAFDSCRLMAVNLFSLVSNAFTPKAEIDYAKLYEVFYMQQRLADNLVDLEIQYVERIIKKIKSDPEPKEIKRVELELWENVLSVAKSGRRTGCGFTALGDMLAALNLKYDSDEAMKVIESVMKLKMEAELDCTIDLAILRGPFEGWEADLEYDYDDKPRNDFYKFVLESFPDQQTRMKKYGRRNVSFSTVAPTGTVSIMTQTTSGLEPLFMPYYMRRKKINPGEEGVRVDFTDQNGDSWQEFPVLHPKFKEWLEINDSFTGYSDAIQEGILDKDWLKDCFESSPWYKSTANDINWENRIKIQGIIQKYTTNAISSTINLPNDVTIEEVHKIYTSAYKEGLKGVTIYRDGCRTGVLVNETTTKDKFGYTEAPKRPKELEADYYFAISKGVKYAVIVGLIDGKPYELFAFKDPLNEGSLKGQIIKNKRGHYSFLSPTYSIDRLELSSENADERLLTRWISLLLRHGANPKFVVEQTEKSEIQITSFAKVIVRVLKKYIPDGEKSTIVCENCGSNTVIFEEGCRNCKSCGYSKCG